MVKVIDNGRYYVEVNKDFTATIFAGGEAFWSRPPEEISTAHPGLMVVKFAYTENPPTREMHPHSDEIITLMEGELEFTLNPGREEKRVRVRMGETVIIPKGTWHCVSVIKNSVAQHILMGLETQVAGVLA